MANTRSVQRVVAAAGELSRRRAQSAVLKGRVTVNDVVCHNPALPVGSNDRVALDGSALNAAPSPPLLWRYWKPTGLLTTHRDTHGRPTVFDALQDVLKRRVISVGRLDRESEGLLLLTTSGALAWALQHPSSAIIREYHACVATGSREVAPAHLEQLERGLTLSDGFRYAPMRVELLARGGAFEEEQRSSPGYQWVRMRLTEGKKHEVRRSWSHFGFAVSRLVRVAYGDFGLEGLSAPGDVQPVDAADVEKLCDAIGVAGGQR